MQMSALSGVAHPPSDVGRMWNWPAALLTAAPFTRILPAVSRSNTPQPEVIEVLLNDTDALASAAQSAGNRARRSELAVQSRSRAKIGSRVKYEARIESLVAPSSDPRPSSIAALKSSAEAPSSLP